MAEVLTVGAAVESQVVADDASEYEVGQAEPTLQYRVGRTTVPAIDPEDPGTEGGTLNFQVTDPHVKVINLAPDPNIPQEKRDATKRLAGQVSLATSEDRHFYAGGVEPKTVYLGKPVIDDWDDGLFIIELYEDYLKAVQQNKRRGRALRKRFGDYKYDRNTVFEGWLTDCYNTLTMQFEKLNREYRRGDIDLRARSNALDLRDRAQAAIRKYLEKSPRGRLIGV